MKKIIPDLHLENCKEALEYYKDLFGGEVMNVQVADGNPMFKGHEGKLMHAELHVNGDCIFYMHDIFGEKVNGSNMDLLLQMDSEEEINRLYTELSRNGTVRFALQKTFWGALHAIVTDAYGITWALNFTIQ